MSAPQSGILPEANSDATFAVLLLQNDSESRDTVRRVAREFPTLVEGFQKIYPDSSLSATISFGSRAWKILFRDQPYPEELAPFKALKNGDRQAPCTPGDILVHIRSNRKDLNFELNRQVMDLLSDSVLLEEEVDSFRYLDSRDMTGFVDGTENPEGDHRADVALIPGWRTSCRRQLHPVPTLYP